LCGTAQRQNKTGERDTDGKASKPQVSALLVAIGRYDSPAYEPLNEAPGAARALAEVFVKGGYTHAHPELLDGGDNNSIGNKVDEWLRTASKDDTIVFYWSGHGKKDADGLFLVTKNTPPSNLTGLNSLSASELGSAVAKSPAEKVLILLDTCYSGAGAGEIAAKVRSILATRPELPGTSPAYAVIASAHPLEKAQEAVFCKALTNLLSQPPSIKQCWTDSDQFIRPADLAEALEAILADQIHCETYGSRQQFIPNPRYKGALPAEDVETRRHRLMVAKEHFPPASRGIEVGEMGWIFSGRTRLLTQLVDWLKSAEHGLVVVTGPAGSGKSAVMGRLATLSDSSYREEAERVGVLAGVPAETLPPIGIIDVAVNLKGKTLFDCIGAIADALDIDMTERDRAYPKTLIGAIGKLDRRITMFFDALDEASPGHPDALAEKLIKPLAMLTQVRVLVATRRSPDVFAISVSESRHMRLKELFGLDALILDLEDEPETLQDIFQYVRLHLRNSRHGNDQKGIDFVAGAIAQRAAGIFLYARIVCRTLQDTEQLSIQLAGDALGAFVDDLTRRFGDRERMVNDVLAALAWGEGKGLTRRVWGPIANTLSRTGALYREGDVAWVLENAGWHIVEESENGQAVYRLAHQAFADHYRRGADLKDVNARIAQALSEGLEGREWLDADGYICRHLASHAAAGCALDALIADPGYLAVAEPIRLVRAFASLTDGRARETADLYRRIAHELAAAETLERMALIHLVACQEAPALSFELEPLLPTTWRCRWARWMSSAPNRILGRHSEHVRTVALGEVDGEPVVVSGCDDKSVRLWDARTGQLRGEPLTGHTHWVTAVALGVVDGEPVVVSGSSDSTVRLWDARTGQLRGFPLTGHSAYVLTVALGEVDGEPVVVSGSADHTVRLWDARTGRPRVGPLSGHLREVHGVALGKVDGESVVVSGSFDDTVRLWDARDGQPRGEPLSGHKDYVTAVALGEVDGEPVVVSGSYDRAVRLWDARTGRPRGEPLTGHLDRVNAVALGEVDGEPVVVSGGASQDHTVRLWDARTGRPRGEPLKGHTQWVTAVALGEVDGEPVVVSGSFDRTVRLWDARTRHPSGERVTRHTGSVNAVALGEVDGEPVVASGSDDQTVRLWDVRTGHPRGVPLSMPRYLVRTVALGEVDGKPVVVSGSVDHTVRLWDVRTGQPRGEPLAGHIDSVTAVALGYMDDEPVVVSGSADNTVRLWDALTGQPRGEPLTGHTRSVMAVALGKVDGEPIVVSGSDDKTVRLWEARTGRPRSEPLTGHKYSVRAVALGEVDREPVVASAGIIDIRLWNTRTGRPRGGPLIGQAGWLLSVALGEVLGEPVVVSGSTDYTLQLWDARSHGLLRTLPLRSPIYCLAMGKDSAVVVGADGGLLVLDLYSI